MNFFDFFKRSVKTKETKRVRVLHGNSVIVELGHRADDSIGMTDYKRYYNVKKGKIYRKLIRHMPKNEQVNFFNTYELTPITDSAYLVIVEKYLSKPQPMPTKIWRVNLTKRNTNSKFVKLKIS